MNGSDNLESSLLKNLQGGYLEMFRAHMAQYQQRIMLQNKCVELSVTVTSGLAVAIVGGAIKWDSTASGHDMIAVAGVGIFLFYVFVQSLLLSNYIYHTWQVHIHNHVYAKVIKFLVKGAEPVPLTPEERSNYARFTLQRGLREIVSKLQGLVIYGSVFFGWVAFLLGVVFCICHYSFGVRSCGSLVLFAVVPWVLTPCFGLFLVDAVLFAVHLQLPSLAKEVVDETWLGEG